MKETLQSAAQRVGPTLRGSRNLGLPDSVAVDQLVAGTCALVNEFPGKFTSKSLALALKGTADKKVRFAREHASFGSYSNLTEVTLSSLGEALIMQRVLKREGNRLSVLVDCSEGLADS
jgi:hypothetical protein